MTMRIHRRDFVRLAGLGMAAGSTAVQAATPDISQSSSRERNARTSAKALMKVGTQHDSSDEVLAVLAAFGVTNICSRLPSARFDDQWSVESLTRLRERVERFGITLDMVPLPMSSNPIARAENPNILLGKSPERDREIDDICQMIRNASRAGIPSLKYNLTLLGVPRTAATVGRGGARYSTFVYDEASQDPPLTEAGAVGEDVYWERITYFLTRVIPVAQEHKVRMACHPQDPGMPKGKGFRGVETVLGSVDGLKRFIEISPSPYHGLNFCQGTVSEMLTKPGEQIYDVIRYFGSRKKIFNVHFRNIRGGFLRFQETFIDDGDVDMLKAMRVYKEVGFDGMMMPDHVPAIDGDARGAQGFAFAFGYIKALIAAVSAES
ncbi:MAG TPA: mannonate dehydratase [Vicinamibacterales bacterium]|nr:mannonate dehydratase [Vicinamibacterales bacterium]